MERYKLILAAGALLSVALLASACSSNPAPTSTAPLPSLTPVAAPTLGPETGMTSTAPTSAAPATDTPTAPPATRVPSTSVPGGSATPAARSTSPAPSVTSPATGAKCTDRATFVADVTVPDGTVFAPGQAFNKIWRVRNTGTCTWDAGYTFTFVSGLAMAGSTTTAVPHTVPGNTVDILVPMKAPMTAGTHRGFWDLKDPHGTRFGRVWVLVRVAGTAPTATATPTP